MARYYAERYDSRYPVGLIPASAPMVKDIVDFWVEIFDVDLASISAQTKRRNTKGNKTSAMARSLHLCKEELVRTLGQKNTDDPS